MTSAPSRVSSSSARSGARASTLRISSCGRHLRFHWTPERIRCGISTSARVPSTGFWSLLTRFADTAGAVLTTAYPDRCGKSVWSWARRDSCQEEQAVGGTAPGSPREPRNVEVQVRTAQWACRDTCSKLDDHDTRLQRPKRSNFPLCAPPPRWCADLCHDLAWQGHDVKAEIQDIDGIPPVHQQLIIAGVKLAYGRARFACRRNRRSI
mmetsp:Transcript_111654/g.316137  ORF Transcript_111654/g.316137 Transcript_111654/m.316137 type:complete len:209 (+) Transcript_111654:263-889(+)